MQLTDTQNQEREKQFYVSFLHTFPTNGNELLAALDDILNGDVVYFQLWTMFKALTKTRSAKFYSNQVKFLLLILIGVLFWNSTDARRFTGGMLYNLGDIVQPQAPQHGWDYK